jgi:hypothetical protein
MMEIFVINASVSTDDTITIAIASYWMDDSL